MSTNSAAPWFADQADAFRGEEPFFFDRRRYPWVADLEADWQTIQTELIDKLAEGAHLQPYMDRNLASKPDRWRTLGLMFWMRRSVSECDRFPKTWALLSKVPNITAASFNLLEPGTTIKPHFGNTNAIMRCHLGLVIPASAPKCAFRVGDETRSWKEGELLMFCDAHVHTAWNNTEKDRYILVVDVMRPEFAESAAAVSARVLAAVNLEAMSQRHALLRKLSGNPMGKRLLMGLLGHWYRINILLFGHRMAADPVRARAGS